MGKDFNMKEMMWSIEGISKLAKSISHPKRLQLLILLEEEDRDFSTLINRTNLKKTALSNHLTLLITNHLVQKSGRGNYQITIDGRELLKATTTVYEKSKSREKFNREKLRKQYSNVRMKMIEKSGQMGVLSAILPPSPRDRRAILRHEGQLGGQSSDRMIQLQADGEPVQLFDPHLHRLARQRVQLATGGIL